VNEDLPYMGIFYSIHSLGVQQWKWEINPPTCVKGLCAESGVVEGKRFEAVVAAQKAIELQTAHFRRPIDGGEFPGAADEPGLGPSEVISAPGKMP
jgi:hypothetical protein